MKSKVFLLFAFAFGVRLIALSQSLWLDEATTARVVYEYGYSQIVTQFSLNDFHPPLYYLFMKAWSNVFGYSEIALRMPSVIFSLLTGWLVYKIGVKIKSYQTGFWAAIFFLFNPLIVYYSQEARMYSMTTFFLTVVIYGVLNLMYEKKLQTQSSNVKTQNLILVNLFICLSFFTFYGSILFTISIYLYFALKRQFRTILLLIPGALIATVAILPLFVQQFINSQVATEAVLNWKQVLGPASLKNVLLIPVKFTSGRISFEPKLVYYIIASAWANFVFYFVFKTLFKHQKSKLLLFLFIFPLFLGFFVSFYTPLLQYFRFLYLIPLLSLLLAFSTRRMWQKYAVSCGFIAFSLLYLLTLQFHREDWRSLAQSLSAESVYMIPSSNDPLRYYNKKIIIKDIRNIGLNPILEDELIIIPYTADIHGINYKERLTTQKFILQTASSNRGVFFEVWKRKTR